MTKVQASKILNIRVEALNKCIKNKIIEVDLTGKINEESVNSYLKELEERRKHSRPTWIKRNEF